MPRARRHANQQKPSHDGHEFRELAYARFRFSLGLSLSTTTEHNTRRERKSSHDNCASSRLPFGPPFGPPFTRTRTPPTRCYPPREASPPWPRGRCSEAGRCSSLLSTPPSHSLSLGPLGAGCFRTLSSAPLFLAILVDAARTPRQTLSYPYTCSRSLSPQSQLPKQTTRTLESTHAHCPRGLILE